MTFLQHKTTSFTASILLHALVLLSLCLYFTVSPESYHLGNEKAQVITSYFYQDAQTLSSHQQQKTTSTPSESYTHRADIGLTKALKKVSRPTHTASPPPQTESQGQAASALVALLHAAIQKEQHYPGSALEMEREGRVTLAFTLFTDGHVDHLRVIKSSGTDSLDQAALTAVHQAAPFKDVNKYLQQAGEYSIDVAFALT